MTAPQRSETDGIASLPFADSLGAADGVVYELVIEGMMCQKNCGTTVQNALTSVPGVDKAVVTFATHSARVMCSPESGVTPEDLVDAVESVGFGAMLKAPPGSSSSADPLVIELLVEGMMCQKNCGTTVQNALKSVDGVASAEVSFEKRKATVTLTHEGSTTLEELVDMVDIVGFVAYPYDPEKAMKIIMEDKKAKQLAQEMGESAANDLTSADNPRAFFKVEGMSCAACVKAIEDHLRKMAGVLDCRVGLISQKAEIVFDLQFGVGKRYYIAAWKGLKHGMMGMDFLIITGTSASYFYSLCSFIASGLDPDFHGHHFFESSTMLLTFVTLGKYMESLAKGKTADALAELAKLQPKTALLIVPGQSDREIAIELVQRGDLLRVVPVSKGPGDHVFGSTINQQAKAIVLAATEQEKLQLNEPSQVHVLPGRGIEGDVALRKSSSNLERAHVLVGNTEFLEEKNIEVTSKIRTHMHDLEMEGKTYLKSMGLDVWLITGDNIRTASAIARAMGIDHVKAIALPELLNLLLKLFHVVCQLGFFFVKGS
ncbi:hypothetical protein P43SY_002796 [Pythium insidiosum]|uniref:HMA domain-containing protein n=1 Tax=Pythium insidiosum TaxID=114742 RepID=A0AAD5LU50_PYTIN|nr:hypothetical protein P43SY_002796 [Pythium insidiosum]